MRVLLTGGGTAGHINPALAIAETVLRNAPGSRVEFVGVKGGKEDELVPRAGYQLHHVKSSALQGKKGIGRFAALALAATSPYLPSTVSIILQNRFSSKFSQNVLRRRGQFLLLLRIRPTRRQRLRLLYGRRKRKIPKGIHVPCRIHQ